MKQKLISLLRKTKFGKRVWAYYKYVFKLSNYFRLKGWIKSIEVDAPVDNDYKPIPWYTYPAIDFLNERIKPNFKVFEYGSGNSSIWLGELVNEGITVEHDEFWYNMIKNKLPENIEYLYRKLDDNSYIKAILEFKENFDIVFIDGRERVACAKKAYEKINDTGVIVWDNSDRNKYKEGFDYLFANGFRRIDFVGIGPFRTKEWCTSIFYRKNNCLSI